MHSVLQRNIRSVADVRRQLDRRKSLSERLADGITAFAGSIWSAYFHALLFGGWLILNTGWFPIIKPWDPFPFVMLAMIASVEAIFLTTFVLISQNRMQAQADQRADLDLQVSLLTEHELTRLVEMVDALTRHLQVSHAVPDVEEIKQDVRPEKVVEAINQEQKQ